MNDFEGMFPFFKIRSLCTVKHSCIGDEEVYFPISDGFFVDSE
jgi:hypothetical protein